MYSTEHNRKDNDRGTIYFILSVTFLNATKLQRDVTNETVVVDAHVGKKEKGLQSSNRWCHTLKWYCIRTANTRHVTRRTLPRNGRRQNESRMFAHIRSNQRMRYVPVVQFRYFILATCSFLQVESGFFSSYE